MNVFSIAAALEGAPGDRASFEAAPADLYPAALADMQDAASRVDQLTPALRQILWPVRDLLTESSIAVALTTKADVLAGGDPAQVSAELAARAALLEAARLWFTEKLHAAINHAPMQLRILKDDAFKL